jgi:N6-L-threonylcarbamoyladenine synthase
VKTLAIETSCDDTALAIVAYNEGNFVVEKVLSFSQLDLHAPYGGVVPELANRSHADKIIRIIEELGGNKLKDEIDFISVTAYPGLPGALVVGMTTAHMLGKMRDKEVVEVNHIMGHVFSILPDRNEEILQTPYICMTVSGGHNDIYLVEE